MAVVQYTFTHKQYMEQRNRHKQYIEQHNSLIRKSADRAPCLHVIPWHLPFNGGKKHGKTSVREAGECQLMRLSNGICCIQLVWIRSKFSPLCCGCFNALHSQLKSYFVTIFCWVPIYIFKIGLLICMALGLRLSPFYSGNLRVCTVSIAILILALCPQCVYSFI
jgi:hypothetical protein